MYNDFAVLPTGGVGAISPEPVTVTGVEFEALSTEQTASPPYPLVINGIGEPDTTAR